tara:strand:- start:4095 stop:4550 length:456 start_codon:yes stop_codon:yes gene_type:complete
MTKYSSTQHFLRSTIAILLISIASLQACAPSISLFSETAYQQAVELKILSLQLMDHASEPFENHRDDIRVLRHELLKAYEFAKGRPDNEFTTEQWEIMMDPEQYMIGGFLNRWEQQGTLSESFIAEAKVTIAEGFDTIIGLESGKIRPRRG